MKVKDGIIGFAIGDAMGVPFEFKSKKEILDNPVIKMVGEGTHNMPKGTWSDDTSMVIATLDSIIKTKKINYDDMAKHFCDWMEDGKYTATDKVFDIGKTTRLALGTFIDYEKTNAIYCGENSMYTNGNGSLMRILPLAYYFLYQEVSEREIIRITQKVSSITHAHEISIMGCYIYIHFIILLLKGFSKEDAYKGIKMIDYHQLFTQDTINEYSRVLEEELDKIEERNIYPSGYVVATLEAVLWTVMNTNNYKDAILTSICFGGDTDTIGALTGGATGILYGYDDIPNEWLNNILRLDYLLDITNKYSTFLREIKK